MMLRQLEPIPGVVSNARCDILAHNRTLRPDGRRPRLDSVRGPELSAAGVHVARLAGTHRRLGRRPARAWSPSSARRWRSTSPSRAGSAWSSGCGRSRRSSTGCGGQHEVRPPENFTKRYLHPEVGLLRVRLHHLWFGQRSEIKMSVYTPADEETWEKVRDPPRPRDHVIWNVLHDQGS